MNKLGYFIFGAVIGAATLFVTKCIVVKAKEKKEQNSNLQDAVLNDDISSSDACQDETEATDSSDDMLVEKEEINPNGDIKIIEPGTEYEYDEYTITHLVYFSDKSLVDETGRMLSDDDIYSLLGNKALKMLDEYEDDSIELVNERLHIIIEIERDLSTYTHFLEENGYIQARNNREEET